MVEVKRPKSWLKSVSAFANGEGGVLIFGVTDDDVVVGLTHAEEDGETISENVKTKLDPVPNINLEFMEVEGAKLILLHVQSCDETPCYYIGDKQRSPGGMMDGRLIQQLDPLTVPSKRRNPLLADIFSRLDLMERRGSGMKKIIDAYRRYERFPNYHAPEFSSNASEFHVTLWNLNYEQFLKDVTKEENGFTKEQKDVTKERKEFLKAQRKIYRYVAEKPSITTIEMAERLGISKRQLLRYIKRLTDMNLIVREGGRKAGTDLVTLNKRHIIFEIIAD